MMAAFDFASEVRLNQHAVQSGHSYASQLREIHLFGHLKPLLSLYAPPSS